MAGILMRLCGMKGCHNPARMGFFVCPLCIDLMAIAKIPAEDAMIPRAVIPKTKVRAK